MKKDLFFRVWNILLEREIKKHMYPGKLVSNYYDFRYGDIALYRGYLTLLNERKEHMFFSNDAMISAIKSRDIEIVKWVYENIDRGIPKDSLAISVSDNVHPIINWLLEKDAWIDEWSVVHSIENREFILAKKLQEIWGGRSSKVLEATIGTKDLDLIKWAFGVSDIGDAAGKAAKIGDLSILKYLTGEGVAIEPMIWRKAATYGRLNILRWLAEISAPQDKRAINLAAKNGHFKTVKWLYERSSLDEVFDIAAGSGNIDMIDWLYRRGLRGSGCAMGNAAKCGDLNMLKWLQNRGYIFQCDTMNLSVLGDNMEVVLWLYNSGAPYNESFLYTAISFSKFEI